MLNLKKHRLRVSRAYIGIVGILILCSLLPGCDDAPPPEIDAIQTAINRSAEYLVDSTRDNGMFRYRINMDPAIEVPERYNILRHAGTIYSMSMYYRLNPDPGVEVAIKRAGRYLRDEAVLPVSGKDGMLAVWSKPDVNKTGKPLQAKLGGTGLGLVALMGIETIHPGFTPLSELQALGRFIVYMQKPNGSFYSKYIPSSGGRWDEWQSLYYPGEAALGLLMLYHKDPSDVWAESAARALAYLARSRENETDVPADHWALLATARLLALEQSDGLPVSRELLINHAVQICDTMLRNQIDYPWSSRYNGGFSADGRTTPTATRLEGLQAALTFLPPDHATRERIEAAVPRGISFLLRTQVNEGEFIGAFPRAIGKIDAFIHNTDGFNRRVTEVRIDYVQHALSALIQYLALVNDKP